MAMDVATSIDARARLPRGRGWERLRLVLLNVLFTFAVLGVGYALWVTYEVKRDETRMKEAEVEQARVELARVVAYNEGLKSQVRFLQTQEGVEKVAREKLGLIRPNETTYIVINAPPGGEPDRPVGVRPAASQKPQSLADRALRWVREVWNGGD